MMQGNKCKQTEQETVVIGLYFTKYKQDWTPQHVSKKKEQEDQTPQHVPK